MKGNEAQTCTCPSGDGSLRRPCPAHPAEAQVQGGGEVVAKPIEWQEDGPGEWCDRHHGFHITQDDEEPQEDRFTAAWGECDPERFPTLDEAQAWCQEALDRYVREWAIAAPPSAPVGVDRLVRAVAAAKRERDETRELSAATMGEMWLALEALAQQPPACGTCGGCGWIDEGHEQDDGRIVAAPGDCPECAQQPAAVDGAKGGNDA